MLPNLLIIGAPKCGTTSIHKYLALHPDIAMSGQKELNFFQREDWRERTDWYEEQFPESATVRGESSPAYTMFPFLPSVAERAHELIPDAKLIYIVRDPLERAVANYVEFVHLTFEDRPIDEALDVDDPANPHLCPSRYATQIERFTRHFELDRILVLDSDDLAKRRQRTLREVFEFLGVDPDFNSPEFGRSHNVRAVKRRYTDLGVRMMRHGILAKRQRGFRRGPVAGSLRRLLSRPVDTTLPASAQERLIAALRPEVDRLRELTGRRFSSWSSFPVEASRAGARKAVPPS